MSTRQLPILSNRTGWQLKGLVRTNEQMLIFERMISPKVFEMR